MIAGLPPLFPFLRASASLMASLTIRRLKITPPPVRENTFRRSNSSKHDLATFAGVFVSAQKSSTDSADPSVSTRWPCGSASVISATQSIQTPRAAGEDRRSPFSEIQSAPKNLMYGWPMGSITLPLSLTR